MWRKLLEIHEGVGVFINDLSRLWKWESSMPVAGKEEGSAEKQSPFAHSLMSLYDTYFCFPRRECLLIFEPFVHLGSCQPISSDILSKDCRASCMRQLVLLRECFFSYSEAIIIFQQVSFKYKPWIINPHSCLIWVTKIFSWARRKVFKAPVLSGPQTFQLSTGSTSACCCCFK